MKITDHLIKKFGFNDLSITVVDVGARQANLDNWMNLGKKLHYYGFEPDEIECAKLNIRAQNAMWGGKEIYYPFALFSDKGKHKFYVTKNPGCSSLYKPNLKVTNFLELEEKISINKIVELKTQTLDYWSQTNNINPIDYIKIDVQGAELDVLKGGHSQISNPGDRPSMSTAP